MISELLTKYKHLIDPNDKMQKNNLKFVEGYIGYQKRKNRDGWEQDCIEFLQDAIIVQEKLLLDIRLTKAKFH